MGELRAYSKKRLFELREARTDRLKEDAKEAERAQREAEKQRIRNEITH